MRNVVKQGGQTLISDPSPDDVAKLEWDHAEADALMRLERALETASQIAAEFDPEPRFHDELNEISEILEGRGYEWDLAAQEWKRP